MVFLVDFVQSFRKIKFFFNLSNGVQVSMVEGNHRLVLCTLLLSGAKIESETSTDSTRAEMPAPFDIRSDPVIAESSTFFNTIPYQVYVYRKTDDRLPLRAIQELSGAIQKDHEAQFKGVFITSYRDWCDVNENSMPKPVDAIRYMTGEDYAPDQLNVLTISLARTMIREEKSFNPHLHQQYQKKFEMELKRAIGIEAKKKNGKKPKRSMLQDSHFLTTKKKWFVAHDYNGSFAVRDHPSNPVEQMTRLAQNYMQRMDSLRIMFDQANPSRVMGLLDFAASLYYFPELRTKFQKFASVVGSSEKSMIQKVEVFLLAVVLPAMEIGELCSLFYHYGMCARLFSQPKSTRRPDDKNDKKKKGARKKSTDDEESSSEDDKDKEENHKAEGANTGTPSRGADNTDEEGVEGLPPIADLFDYPAIPEGKERGFNPRDGTFTKIVSTKSKKTTTHKWVTFRSPLEVEAKYRGSLSLTSVVHRRISTIGFAAAVGFFLDVLIASMDGTLDESKAHENLRLYSCCVYNDKSGLDEHSKGMEHLGGIRNFEC